MTTMSKTGFLFLALTFFLATCAVAQHIPSPKEHFGFHIGDDYQLANYTQTEAYFKKLAALSDRVLIEKAGETSEGRDQYLLIVSSPKNLAEVQRYQSISQQMARADFDEAQARQLATIGKPVVWIDGGLHSTETVATHQLIETLYQLLSRNDAENQRILDEVVILLFHCNPDGHELVSDWYMKDEDVTKRNKRTPTMYHKYVGHDNNRDFYMNNLKETTTISRLQYIDWNPQIIYNHHQTAPAGTVVAGPPYRDPFNHVIDPLLITGIDGVAAAMVNRLNQEDRPGYTRLSGSVFSTWWNGGLRTTPYYHNSIGILTEIIGDPTPSQVPLVPDRLIPNNATPNPAVPTDWNFKKSIDYSVSLNYAILDYASRYGDQLLYNMYKMGRNAIERGSRDYWTHRPAYIDQIKANYEADQKNAEDAAPANRSSIPASYFEQVFADPARRDPRGFIIPADQTDFARAVDFINALIKSGIQIHEATDDFTVNGKSYPRGSYVVLTAQAFRPHVLDMLEPQDHPNDFQYPGGPPVRPYDAAGWTLAYQFGIDVDRVLDGFDAPLNPLPLGELQTPPAAEVAKAAKGYLLSTEVNNSFAAVNQLLAAGIPVYRTSQAVGDVPAGTFYVPAKGHRILQDAAASLGVRPQPAEGRPQHAVAIKPRRIGLYDYYGGSMPSGWVRWLLEQYRYDQVSVVYPQEIDAGKLHENYDVLLFIGGGIPGAGSTGGARTANNRTEGIPDEFHHLLGSFTLDESLASVRDFLERGGTVLSVGSATSLGYHLGLPVNNALTETDEEGNAKPLSGEKFYAPGSVHEVHAATDDPIAFGMPTNVNVMSSNSPLFAVDQAAAAAGVKKLAWYGSDNPLKSGWIWGAEHLRDGVAAYTAPVGKGTFYAFGPEITFRAQSHGTFKWLFNALYTTP